MAGVSVRGGGRHTSWGKLRAAVYNPTTTRSTVNAAVSHSGRTRAARRPPKRLPTMAASVNTPRRVQSRWTPCPILETRAEALLIAITSNEVPTATGIVKPSTSTSAGTAAKPPPTPKNPVSRPTADAVMSTLSARDHARLNDGRSVMMGTSFWPCLLYTSDAADDLLCVDLGGRRIIKK